MLWVINNHPAVQRQVDHVTPRSATWRGRLLGRLETPRHVGHTFVIATASALAEGAGDAEKAAVFTQQRIHDALACGWTHIARGQECNVKR